MARVALTWALISKQVFLSYIGKNGLSCLHAFEIALMHRYTPIV